MLVYQRLKALAVSEFLLFSPRFQTLDLKHRGVLSPKELARLAWAMEPNWDFEDGRVWVKGWVRLGMVG